MLCVHKTGFLKGSASVGVQTLNLSLTPHEEKVLPALIKRGMHNSHTLQVKTGENKIIIIISKCMIIKPLTLVKVTEARLP